MQYHMLNIDSMKMAPTTLIQLFNQGTHTTTNIRIDIIRIIEFNQLLCPILLRIGQFQYCKRGVQNIHLL